MNKQHRCVYYRHIGATTHNRTFRFTCHNTIAANSNVQDLEQHKADHISPKKRFLQNREISFASLLYHGTHSGSGASLRKVGPPTISRVQTSRMNQATCPTAHPRRSPAAARHVPFSIHARPTKASGRYGAVIVTIPKSEMGVDGWRRDQR